MISEKVKAFNEAIKDRDLLQNPLIIAGADLQLRELEARSGKNRQIFTSELAATIISSFSLIALDDVAIPAEEIKGSIARMMRVWSWVDTAEKPVVKDEILHSLSTRPIPLKQGSIAEIRAQNAMLLGMFETFDEFVSANIAGRGGAHE
ncbi:MAG: hypothetical protein KA035_03555 [Candidatus Levybacteria bacterium]|nr:hypothetical protein [Candidatus Levybacteria bacterium]